MFLQPAEVHRCTQLAAWGHGATILEQQLLNLQQQVQEGERPVKVAQEEAREAHAAMLQAGREVVEAKQLRRATLARAEEIEASLNDELQKGRVLSQSISGLQRSLARVQQRAACTTAEIHAALTATETESALQEELQQEMVSMKEAIDNMREMCTQSSEEAEAERAKRLELKGAVRGKFERLAATRCEITERQRDQAAKERSYKEELAQEEARVGKARKWLQECQHEVRQVDEEIKESRKNEAALLRQLVSARSAHDGLSEDHRAMEVRLHDERQVQNERRLHHLAVLDAKLRVRRRLDKDMVVIQRVPRSPDDNLGTLSLQRSEADAL